MNLLIYIAIILGQEGRNTPRARGVEDWKEKNRSTVDVFSHYEQFWEKVLPRGSSITLAEREGNGITCSSAQNEA